MLPNIWLKLASGLIQTRSDYFSLPWEWNGHRVYHWKCAVGDGLRWLYLMEHDLRG